MLNFFASNESELKNFIRKELEWGLKDFLKQANMDLNSPIAGMIILGYFGNFRQLTEKPEYITLIRIKYSLSEGDAKTIIDKTIREVQNEWLE